MRTGSLVADRFIIDGLAASGGMGAVYRAVDRESGQTVAVKVLRRDLPEAERRFELEARLLGSFDHPGIVRYRAHGVLASGERYLAMEWLEGETLAARLARERLSAAEVVRLGTAVADALGALHERGVVHRDLKPSNIFLVGGRCHDARLLDLGVAFLETTSRLTLAGTVIGTAAYMAPEQVAGSRAVDSRSDIFSLGAVLYECLAGQPAFGGAHPVAVMTRIVLGDTPRIIEKCRRAPLSLAALIDRMLAKDPRIRPADGSEVAGALRSLGEVFEIEEQATAELPEWTALTARERRPVALLFIGPPAAGSDALASALADVAAMHGGHLEPFADGSAAVLVSGSSVATDLAAQAARCALSVRDHAGGRAMTLAIARSEAPERPLDLAIDNAARLLAASRDETVRSGSVLLDDTSAGLLGVRFEVREQDGTMTLVGERDVGEVRLLLGKATPYVGREHELQSLEELFDACVDEGQAQAVVVTSPAGMGKSRLGREFLERLRRRGGSVAIWTARAELMGAGSPLGLLAQAVRSACGLHGAEPAQEQIERLHGAVAARVPDAERLRVAEFLGEIIGARVPGEGSDQLRAARQDAALMGTQISAAVVTFLRAECAVRPVVILLEDLHWGDAATVRMLDTCLRELADRPLFMLALARPEIHEVFPKLWTERRHNAMWLNPLSRKASEQLARQVLGSGVSSESVQRIVQLAEGNAFYLEELIRALADGRVAADLPDSVVAMVHARLAKLGEELRRTLRAASVYGETFWAGGVTALVAGGDAGGAIRPLSDLELVTPRRTSRLAGEIEYAFRHALVREGAYAMLTSDDRALGHRLAGEWLEEHGERDPVVLAEHFMRGGTPTRAAPHYLRAAEAALDGLDSDAALRYARRGLDAAATGATRHALLGIVLETNVWRLQEDASLAASAEEVLSHETRGTVAWERAALAAVLVALTHGRIDDVRSLVETVMSSRPAPMAQAAMAFNVVGASYWLGLLGFERDAGRFMARIASVVAGFSPRDLAATAWVEGFHAFRVSYVERDPWQGVEQSLGYLEKSRTIGHARQRAIAHIGCGSCFAHLGAATEARAHLSESTLADEDFGGSSSLRPFALAWVALQVGDLVEARQHADHMLELGRSRHFAFDEARGLWITAETLRRAGDLDGAAAAAEAALRISFPIDVPGILATIAAVRLGQARIADALAAARQGIEKYRESGICSHFLGSALLLLIHAECLAAAGLRDAARAAIAEAEAWVQGIAGKIPSGEYRTQFLEAIPEHRRILALAAEWRSG